MRSPFQWISELICARPMLVAGIIFGIFLVSLYGTTLLTMETGEGTYIDKDTQRGMLLDTYSKNFQSDAVMIIIETDDVTSPLVLDYFDRLLHDISNERYVAGTSSVVDLFKQSNGGTLPRSLADVSAAKEALPPGLLDRYLPSNLLTIGIVTIEPGTSSNAQNALLENIESIIAISEPPPGVSITVTGNPAFQKQMGEEIGTSMGTLILGAMLLMIVAVGLLFSHVRYRFLPVAIVASGLVLTFGIMGLAGIPLSMVVIGAFPVLIGIGIDYAIQFHSRFDEEVARTSIPEAVKTTITKSGPAVLFAMIATSLGFIAMFVSPVPMVGDFGFTCTIGVASCYLMALLIVPTFGILSRYRPKEKGKGRFSDPMVLYDRALGSLAGKIARTAVPVILVLGFVAVVGIQLDATIPINTNEDTFVPRDMPAVVDLKKVTRTMGSTESMPIYVRGDNVLHPDTLRWIEEFSEYEVTHNDKVTGAQSIASSLAMYNGGVLPSTEVEVMETLARIPPEITEGYVNGRTDAVIQFSLVNMENEVALGMVKQVERDLDWKAPPPGITATPTGTLEMFTSLMGDIRQGKTEMTFLGFGLIFVFLLLVYRKITAISPLIPIMMIVGWNGVIMFVLGIDYSPMTAVLGSMTIGVASEYTILIMERCQEERARGRDMISSIQESVQKIGTAVTVSGMTTVFGFSALLLSTFNIVKNFGIVTVITVGFSLIGAIIVMPAVLSVMGSIGQCETGESSPEST
ncbi:MAG: hydrophobe/amphiphile efflux-3 (HAE3) family transporter [Methanomicrobiaceae archaeon]|nr:hydrophobe/amphiphile efflux-3 (HAE3) family transporter [Methanomicrobiaceae archaeon]